MRQRVGARQTSRIGRTWDKSKCAADRDVMVWTDDRAHTIRMNDAARGPLGREDDELVVNGGPVMRSCAGDWVEVASKVEILATLDEHGRLEGMPFMPEMFEYCGKRYRVYKRGHKSCDTLNPLSSRAVPQGVFLEGMRCGGGGHGGCQAACSIIWKEAWLKPVDGPDAPPLAAGSVSGAGCTEADVERATVVETKKKGAVRYRCQATDFPEFSALI